MITEIKTIHGVGRYRKYDMNVDYGTEINDLVYNDNSWNREYLVYVFNDQYIDNYVYLDMLIV